MEDTGLIPSTGSGFEAALGGGGANDALGGAAGAGCASLDLPLTLTAGGTGVHGLGLVAGVGVSRSSPLRFPLHAWTVARALASMFCTAAKFGIGGGKTALALLEAFGMIDPGQGKYESNLFIIYVDD